MGSAHFDCNFNMHFDISVDLNIYHGLCIGNGLQVPIQDEFKYLVYIVNILDLDIELH